MVFLDDTFMKIDGVLLPGLFKSLEVNADAAVEEQEVEGNAKKPKQATGYEDAKITVELSLMDGPELTMQEKLLIIQGKGTVFKTEKDITGRELIYFSLENVVFPRTDAETTVEVEAEKPGSDYNVPAGRICRTLTHLDGVGNSFANGTLTPVSSSNFLKPEIIEQFMKGVTLPIQNFTPPKIDYSVIPKGGNKTEINFGDIKVEGVQNPEQFAKEVVKKMPNSVLQEMYRH